MKITIKDVYGTLNNGGAFDIYGLNCVDPSNLDKEDSASSQVTEALKSKTIALSCEDNISGNVQLSKIGLKAGDKINIECQESCANSPALIYGDLLYSQDSGICKSAFHSGKLSNSGGKLILAIDKGI